MVREKREGRRKRRVRNEKGSMWVDWMLHQSKREREREIKVETRVCVKKRGER